MKIGDLKIATLKILELPQDNMLYFDRLSEIETEDAYIGYLEAFLPSLQRSLMRITTSKVLPYKTVKIDANTPLEKNNELIVKAKIRNLAEDIYNIEDVFYEDTQGDITKCGYSIYGGYLTIKKEYQLNFKVVYAPRLPLIISNENINDYDLDILEIPDEIQNIIPYAIKADIYEEDSPSKANQARNLFEAYLNEFKQQETYTYQTEVARSGGF